MVKQRLKLKLKEECFICYTKIDSYIFTNTCYSHRACTSCFLQWFSTLSNRFKCPYCRQNYQIAYLKKNRKRSELKCFSNNFKMLKHRYYLADVRIDDDDQDSTNLKITFDNLYSKNYVGFKAIFIDLPNIRLIPKVLYNMKREICKMIPLAIETDCLINNQDVKLAKLKEIEIDNMGIFHGQTIKLTWMYCNKKESNLTISFYKVDSSISIYEIMNNRGKLIYSKAYSELGLLQAENEESE